MKTTSLLTLLTLLTFSMPIFADHSCIKEKWTLAKEEVVTPAICTLSKDLKLVRALISFPNINVGPINVGYWEGQYVKSEKVTQTYRHDYINVCSGQITYSEEFQEPLVKEEAFSIINPNLDPSITESYRLVPMTDEEAMVEFKKLPGKCAATLNQLQE